MKEYVKILLYAYPLLKTVEKDYEEHIKNRAVLSYDCRYTAEQTAEYLAKEILRMRSLEWLKGRIEELINCLSEEERELLSLRYFGKRRREGEGRARNWTERTYFRRQQRLGEKLCGLFILLGVTEEVYEKEYRDEKLFSRIARCVREGKDRKISANERRYLEC